MENLVERELVLHSGGELIFSTILQGSKQRDMQPVAGNGRSLYPLNLYEAIAVHIAEVLKLAKGKIDALEAVKLTRNDSHNLQLNNHAHD